MNPMPFPPPVMTTPPPAGAPPTLVQRNLRTSGFVAGGLIVLLIVLATYPIVSANALKSAYPKVKAVISASGVASGGIVREGQSITFSAANSTGHSLTYDWTLPDGSETHGQTVTRSFTQYTSNATVNLTVSDPLGDSVTGHSASANFNFQVFPAPPTANFTASFGQVNTYSGTVTENFDASGSSGEGLQQYNWNFGDGNSGTSYGPSESHDYQTLGTYTVTLQVTDDAGQQASTQQSVQVSVPAPTASFKVTNTSVSAGFYEEVDFDASASKGAITQYTWDFGDGSTPDTTYGPTDIHFFNQTGTFTVTLTVVDSFGRTATAQLTVTVNF